MSDKQSAVLSFVGGLVFLSVLTTVLLNRNGSIRAEAESQVQGFLNTSKEALHQMRLAVAKLGAITGSERVGTEDGAGEHNLAHLLSDGYEALWQSAEAQNRTYVKDHPSR
jgi:hypothetical protein